MNLDTKFTMECEKYGVEEMARANVTTVVVTPQYTNLKCECGPDHACNQGPRVFQISITYIVQFQFA